jgi:hypothetical protein
MEGRKVLILRTLRVRCAPVRGFYSVKHKSADFRGIKRLPPIAGNGRKPFIPRSAFCAVTAPRPFAQSPHKARSEPFITEGEPMTTDNTPKRPTHRVYAVTKRGENSYSREIGAFWAEEGGDGFLKLDYLPLNGARIVIRKPKAEDAGEGGAQ